MIRLAGLAAAGLLVTAATSAAQQTGTPAAVDEAAPASTPPKLAVSADAAQYLVRESHAYFGAERRTWLETSARATATLAWKALVVEAGGLVLKTAGDDKFGSGSAPAGAAPGDAARGRPVRGRLDKASVRLANIGGSSLALTAGRQHIAIGSQFLVGDGVYDGFSADADQAIWHNPRRGFDAIRAQWTAWRVGVDAFVYRVHPTWDAGGGNDGLVGGVDVSGESRRTAGRYALGVFHRRSGSDLDTDMPLVNVRATQPLPAAPGGYASGELVWEMGRCRSAVYCTSVGQSMHEYAWHAEAGFSADGRRGRPSGEIGYVRYSDDFTPLATGFSDWGRWYLGNQIDWMIFGTNSSIVRAELGIRPRATLRVRGQFHSTRLVAAPAGSPHALTHEASLIAEWTPVPAAWITVVAGRSVPAAGLARSGLGNPFAALNAGAAPTGTRASFDLVVAVGYAFSRSW